MTVLTLALASTFAWAIDPPPPSLQILPPLSFSLDTDHQPVSIEEFGGASEELDAGTASEVLQSHADLWAHLRSGFSLPDFDDPLVRKHEAWYAKRPDYVARMVERSQRYMYFIVNEVEKRGMPLEIALLPMIESAYNPMALSPSHALGIWQFIPSTGKLYGMQQTWWFDARRDVVAATTGALDYLQTLHGQFGDWMLALAAYNWGEGAVARAIERNRKRHLPTDYASLRMPAETRNYIPTLQAVKNIATRPEAFGLQLASIPDTPYFKTVEVPSAIDVKLVAELAEMPQDEFLMLNPAYNRPVIAGAPHHTVLLPYDKAEAFQAKLMLQDQPLVSWRAYRLKVGDKLEAVAARCGLSVNALKAVNGVSARKHIPLGFTLLLPVKGSNEDAAASLHNAVFTSLPADRASMHLVKKGDTLAGIASRYGVSIPELRGWNSLQGRAVTTGEYLRVSASSERSPSTSHKHRTAASKTTPHPRQIARRKNHSAA